MSRSGETGNEDMVLDNHELLQVHLAEYASLTNRCNYWITVQFALLPLFLAVVGVVAEMWKSSGDPRPILWGGMLVSQLIVMTWLHTGLEMYRVVLYLECALRPLIGKPGIPNQRLWGYEAFLARQRSNGPRWEEYLMSLLIIAALIVVLLLRWPPSVKDYIGLGLNVFILVPVLIQSWRLVVTRREFSRCALLS